jgi:hypothetical protein
MKSKKIDSSIQKNWLDSICERTQYQKSTVQGFLKKYKIQQTPAVGNPKRIHIVSVQFSGTKQGLYDSHFKFTFEGLGPGLWGLFSDGNSKGKTTALEVIKWLIKGRSSDGLQDGVKSWISDAELKLQIDSTFYGIRVLQLNGELEGQIVRSNDGSKFTVYKEFNSENEMESIVADFMLDQLDLGQIASFRQGDSEVEVGKEVVHGWPALSSAMFIGTSYGAIFGDHAMSGLPNRILNMYLGLPWIPTYTALKALKGQLKSTASVQVHLEDHSEKNRLKRLEEIRTTLKTKETEIKKIPKPEKNKAVYNSLVEQYNRVFAQKNEAYKSLTEASAELSDVENSYSQDQKKLNNFKEDRAANKVFKQLNPSCCPHCEQKVTSENLEREKNEHSCAICSRPMLESEDAEEIFAELHANAEASNKAYTTLKYSISLKTKAYSSLEKSLQEQATLVHTYKQELDAEQLKIGDYMSLEAEISRLKILEKEYETPSSEQAVPIFIDSTTKSDETLKEEVNEDKILDAAIKETEERFKSLQEELLNGVNGKMLDYCKKVGLNQYLNVSLNSQPSLKITKDGGETSFSKVSKGEQLRLKVIATIALISVAEEKKLGRHPGFLVIDSPAAQEVNVEDLNNMIAGLEDLKASLPSLQIILASVANETLLSHVDERHRKYAKGNEFLW